MKTLYVSINAETDLISKINKKSNNSSQISIAAVKYSKLISEGLNFCSADHMNLFLLPIGMFPNSKILFFYKKSKSNNHYIPFINIFLIKQTCVVFYTLFFIMKWHFIGNSSKKYIIFGFLYLPFLLSIIPFKFSNKVTLVSFVPDLPKFIFSYTRNKSVIKNIIKYPYIKITTNLANLIDYYVLITKYMKTQFPKKKFQIIEGFTDSNYINNQINFTGNKNSIMYAGALFEKFGVSTLIDAFMDIPGDYELWLFGYGDLTNKIIEQTKIDKRIIYFGNVSNEKVEEYEIKAKLLVNPRPLLQEFTKYSFPSKILEYMSSGTPVLTTKLLGIPEEYDDKLYYFVNDSYLEIKNGLIKYLNYNDEELFKFGMISRNFVLEEKNNKIQISKLLYNLQNI